MKPTTGRSLPASASGISTRWASIPLSDRRFRIASAVCGQRRLVKDRDLVRAVEHAPSSPSRPVPMITGYGGSTSNLDGDWLGHGSASCCALADGRR